MIFSFIKKKTTFVLLSKTSNHNNNADVVCAQTFVETTLSRDERRDETEVKRAEAEYTVPPSP